MSDTAGKSTLCCKEHTAHIDDPQSPTKAWLTCGDETIVSVDLTDEIMLPDWFEEQMRVHCG